MSNTHDEESLWCMSDELNHWMISCTYSSGIYIGIWKYQHKEVQMVFDGSKLMNRSKWYMSFDLRVCPICACLFKGDSVTGLWLTISCAHVVVVPCEAAIVLQSNSINLSIYSRNAATGPTLSLTTDHMYLLCSLDFGMFIQWSGCKNCFLVLLTLDLCRFPFHTQDTVLVRSYYRLSSLAVASVDGFCLYIIIHNSISYRSWL